MNGDVCGWKIEIFKVKTKSTVKLYVMNGIVVFFALFEKLKIQIDDIGLLKNKLRWKDND